MVEIVRGDVQSVPGIAALEGVCFSEAWSHNAMLEHVTCDRHVTLVAHQDGETVGYCLAQDVIDGLDILRIAVHPDCRRSGIASALLASLECEASRLGRPRVLLDVREANKGARDFYRARGFREDGLRKGYYRDPAGIPEDAVLMSKAVCRGGSVDKSGR